MECLWFSSLPSGSSSSELTRLSSSSFYEQMKSKHVSVHIKACVCLQVSTGLRKRMSRGLRWQVLSAHTAVEQMREEHGHTNTKSVKVLLKAERRLGAIWAETQSWFISFSQPEPPARSQIIMAMVTRGCEVHSVRAWTCSLMQRFTVVIINKQQSTWWRV